MKILGGFCYYVYFCRERNGWTYSIYSRDDTVRELARSMERFVSRTEAQFAAMGHISLMEQLLKEESC